MKQLLEQSKKPHIEQLVQNMEQQSFTTLFPIQLLTLGLDDENAFIQSPCGSGKTLAALLPYLLRNDPQLIIYLSINTILCFQVQQLLQKLFHKIPTFQLTDFQPLKKKIPTNKTLFTVTTPQQLQLFLQKNKLQIHQKTVLIIDEADQQIKQQPLLFNQLFKLLTPFNYSVSNAPFCKQTAIQIIFMSATLKMNEHLLNNLNLKPGKFYQLDSMQQKHSFQHIQTTQYLEFLYSSIKSHAIQTPCIVFVPNFLQIDSLTMDLMTLKQPQESFSINVLYQNLKEVQSDFLNINQPILENNIVITTSEFARGFDYHFKTAISCGVVENDELIHRMGRAGRGLDSGVGVYLGTERKIDILAQLGQIQVFTNFENYLSENHITEGIQTVKEFQKFKKESGGEQIGLMQFLDGM